MKNCGGVYECKYCVLLFQEAEESVQYGVLSKLLSWSHCSALLIFQLLQKFHIDLSHAEVVTNDG
jgi:hypothetical protein